MIINILFNMRQLTDNILHISQAIGLISACRLIQADWSSDE